METLSHELAVFRRELPHLLVEPGNRGKYVLIHGDDVVGVWPTLDETLAAGYDRFINDAFLAKEITDVERVYYSSRNVNPCP